MSDEDGKDIALVGVCGAGKSTIGRLLRDQGWRVREIHQEHSYVPHMWRTIRRPQVLVYLDVTWDEVNRRRPHPSYGPPQHAALIHRLRDARAHADVYILTDGLTAEEVAREVSRQLAAI